MALRAWRQVYGLNVDFPTIHTAERGGILTFAVVSGIRIVQYATNPSGAIPLGIQYNDVEYMDLSRHYDPRRLREVEVSLGIVGAAYGEFETNWTHIIGPVFPGDVAYVGPSGTFTNSSSFGSYKVGYFLSALEPGNDLLIFTGGGFSREKMLPKTHEIVVDNDPRAIIYVLSSGYIKVKISQQEIIRSQQGL